MGWLGLVVMTDKYPQRINHELDALGNPIHVIRTEPVKEGEVLYDKHGKATVIITKGQLLAILEDNHE